MQNLTDSQQQNLVYLVLLLAVLLSGLVMRRDITLRRVLRDLVVWGCFGLVFVGIYSYRYEFFELKRRILGELRPSQALTDEKGRLVINIARDGHFYLDTRINGQDVRFMVDTGASDMVLNVKDAKKVGIDVLNLNFNRRYNTANGVVFGASVVLDEVEVARGRVFYGVRASVNSADLGVSLLGMSFLRQHFEGYKVRRDKMILY